MRTSNRLFVANMTHMVELLARDCGGLQFIREATQNAIEAIQRAGRTDGRILWCVNTTLFGSPKLCIADNGCGMTEKECLEHLKGLSSSGNGEVSLDGNYGMGARISSLAQNPYGIHYATWKDKVSTVVLLKLDPKEKQYGLADAWEDEDGEPTNVGKMELSNKEAGIPAFLRKTGSGTMVVFGGTDANHNTSLASGDERVGDGAKWVWRFLNMRYYRFPANVSVSVEEMSGSRVQEHRMAKGQEAILRELQQASGTIPLTDAVAHWWILEDRDTRGEKFKTASMMTKLYRGHVGYLHKDELYNVRTGNTATARIQQCGIIFGVDRIVLYIEPLSKDTHTNITRTSLEIEAEEAKWAEWGKQIRENMPEAIRKFQEEYSSKAPKENHNIEDVLRDIARMFKTKPGIIEYHPPGGKKPPRKKGNPPVVTGKSRKKRNGPGPVADPPQADLEVPQGRYSQRGRDGGDGGPLHRGGEHPVDQRGLLGVPVVGAVLRGSVPEPAWDQGCGGALHQPLVGDPAVRDGFSFLRGA